MGVIVKAGLWTGPWTGPWTGLWTEIWTGFWTELSFSDDHFLRRSKDQYSSLHRPCKVQSASSQFSKLHDHTGK